MDTPDLDTIHELPLRQRVLGPILRERAARDRERTYIRFGERRWTFGETDALVRDLARGLMDLGLEKGERVGLFMPNDPAFIFGWYATNLAGGATVPINPAFTSHLLDYILEDADVRALVTTRALLPVVAGVAEQRRARLRFIALVDEDADGAPASAGTVLSLQALGARGRERGGASERPLDFTDVHSIMYTSGTTGPSKGAIVPNGHYFAASCTFLRAVNLQRDDVLYTPLPLFHGLASRLGALPCLMVGAEYVLAPRFSASRFWQDVTECGATVAHTIFTLPAMLKAQPSGPYDRAHGLRAMYNSNHDPEFEQRFNVRLCEAYGLTEVGLSHYTRYPERRPGSCGKAHEDWDARIVDAQGVELPDGEVGEIVLRPKLPSIMMDGYVNKPQETVRVTRNLWFHTGDFGRRDADGYFYFVARHKDRIRRRGENVSPLEVEHILCRHPAVADCAALAHPAREGEDDIRAVLVLKPGAHAAPREVMDWLAGRMPYFMMPRYIEFAAALPRNPVGKVEKYKLLDAGLAADAWDREAQGYVVRRDAPPQPIAEQP
jgi:carnitine-CoA ligase